MRDEIYSSTVGTLTGGVDAFRPSGKIAGTHTTLQIYYYPARFLLTTQEIHDLPSDPGQSISLELPVSEA